MPKLSEFEQYMTYLCEALGHADRHAGFVDYSRGLMLPIERKSVEPLAAHTDPWHVSAKHQSLHHFVAKSEWSDEAVLARVRNCVAPHLKLTQDCYWIVDDTGFPKKGKCSVGVARQYCGQLGKQDNCQVAVSLSLASASGSVPIAYRLYLPKEWADDATRRGQTGVPDEIEFATKPEIALMQMRRALGAGVPVGVVLADAGYGNETAFREGVSALQLTYVVGVQGKTTVWAPGTKPLPPKPKPRTGRPPTLLRRAPDHAPVSVKELAEKLSAPAWHEVSWREGTNTPLASRFAAIRVRAAHRDHWRSTLREEQWLLIEWPETDSEPIKYWLSTLPAASSLEELVSAAKMRWRIERDYQELKQQFGLSQFEGRGWRGFHHHATLCIAAYAFLMTQRLKHGGSKKNSARPKTPALPKDYTPRGSRATTTPRARLYSHLTLPHCPSDRKTAGILPVLRGGQCCLMTQ
jgi:SRSO17 transposase